MPLENKYIKNSYSIKEAQQYLSLGRTSIYDAMRRGDLKAYRYKGGKHRTVIFKADLDTFLYDNVKPRVTDKMQEDLSRKTS